MKRVLTLDELAGLREDQTLEYGLKTSELADLHRLIPGIDVGKRLYIPSLFALPALFNIENPEVKEAYFALVKNLSDKRIILARSSASDESPGKYESHPSLWDPEQPEKSFKGWKEAAYKVKDSGSEAVIGHLLACDLVGLKKCVGSPRMDDVIFCFGAYNTGLVLNSSNFVLGDYPTIVAAWGLPSKIVRGDKDVSMIIDTDNDTRSWRLVNIAHDYLSSSAQAEFVQRTMDIVKPEEPETISTIQAYQLRGFGFSDRGANCTIPFSERPDYLIKVIREIRKKTDKEIEIEGICMKGWAALIQLRKYELPERKIESLTDVLADQIIYTSENAIGNNKLVGDLYVAEDPVDIPNGGIFFLSEHQIGFLSKIEDIDYSKFIFTLDYSNKPYAGSHFFGDAVQKLLNLKKQGTEAIANNKYDGRLDLRNIYKHSNRVEETDKMTIYRDVTVECCGNNMQIYFNVRK